MFGPEKYKKQWLMESTPKSRSVGIAYLFKHISIAIWLNSLEYQFRGRDIRPFLEKSTWNQPIPQSLSDQGIFHPLVARGSLWWMFCIILMLVKHCWCKYWIISINWELSNNREWKQALKRTSALSRLYYSTVLAKYHVCASFCVVNSAPAQYVFIMT